MEDCNFRELLRRIRAGDADAAAQLVREYEQEIRRVARFRLTDPRIRCTVESMDVCQSVLGNFFIRVAAGQFDLESPEQLLRLLLRMASNKALEKIRNEMADRRDARRRVGGDSDLLDALAGKADSPSRIIAGRELLQRVRALLSPENLYLMDQRTAGRPWAELGEELDRPPDNLRKQLERALDKVAVELGLQEQEEEER
jgi:RNA polymerase sigma-70 factor (ECF subfamily)